MSIEAIVTLKDDVKIPRVPNFIFLAKTDAKVPVSHFPEDKLREIGERWTERLIERAKEQGEAMELS